MAEAPPLQVDPDFEPLSRPRSCTWPLPEPIEAPGSGACSPAPSAGNGQFAPGHNLRLLQDDLAGVHLQLHLQQQPPPRLAPRQQVAPSPPPPLPQRKTSSSRRNAWGNMSYADLITRAIESSPEKRLTLSQIYDWMVNSVPYFKDKGDSNSSAGWKNSIRHNLSLHSRFVRIQNEGTGKSSWWTLNPEGGKNGKSPRRRAASMDNSSKFARSRGRATKKKMGLQDGVDAGASSPASQYSKWPGSPSSLSNEDFEPWSHFRTRAGSDASTLSGRRSPFPAERYDLGEADGHLIYPGGAKIAPSLPDLSEMSGCPGGPEMVMENLAENMNLLFPKNPRMASDSSDVLRSAPYNSFPERMYAQARIQDYGASEKQYVCPAGLLKELLPPEADASGNMITFKDSTIPLAGRACCPPANYDGRNRPGLRNGARTALNLPLGHVNPHAPPTSRDLNSCTMIPLSSPSGGPLQMRTPTQLSRGHPNPAAYRRGNGYGELEPHVHRQERLPSDLDNMSLESLECDVESVLYDTLMDGGALDFNFEPSAGSQSFPQRVKTATHGWVSG